MKSFLFLPLLLLGVLFTSCKKEEIIQEITPNRTINFTVQPGAWVLDNATATYYAELPVPEIDDRVNRTNGILVYISSDNKTFEPIPDVYNGSTFIFTHTIGKIFLEVQGADGATIDPPEDIIYVKVVLVESEPV